MTSIVMWTLVWVLGTALYFNVGYIYVKYMDAYDSSYSHLRRFLAGGWNTYGDKQDCDVTRDWFACAVALWILFFIFSLLSWVAWIIWKIIYFIFGGISKELKNKDDE